MNYGFHNNINKYIMPRKSKYEYLKLLKDVIFCNL